MSWVNNVLGEQVVTGQAADRDQPLPFGGGMHPLDDPVPRAGRSPRSTGHPGHSVAAHAVLLTLLQRPNSGWNTR